MSAGDSAGAPTAADLLAHAEFLRAIAWRILRDEHAAEDVVQDALVVAIESPPRSAWSLRAWLAGVAANLARMRVRSEARRAARERAVALSGTADSALDVAERLDFQRRLVGEVMRLEEPFRTTIVLRFLDDVPAAEIARRHGVPVATVHSRIARGVRRLRVRFLAEEPARSRTALLVLAGGAAVTTVQKTALAAVIVALVLAAGGGFLAGRGSSARPIVPVDPQASAGGTEQSMEAPPREHAERRPRYGGELADDEELARLRAENETLQARIRELEQEQFLPPGPDTVFEVRVTQEAVTAGTGTLRCLVHDRRGRPVAEQHLRLLNPMKKGAASASLVTDADGRAEFTSLEPSRYQLTVEFAQGGWERSVEVQSGHVSVAKLWVWGPEAASLSGRVTRYGGAPAGGARLFLSRYMETVSGMYTATADADGRYAFEDLPAGILNVTATVPIENLRFETHVEVEPGGHATADFELGTPTLHGTVRDEVTGQAIENATVILSDNRGWQPTVGTDADGHFAFLDTRPGKFTLIAFRAGYGALRRTDFEVGEGPRQIDLVLPPAATLRLHVLNSEGTPFVGDIHLYARPSEPGSQGPFIPTIRTDIDGRAVCDYLVPGEYELRVVVFKVLAVGVAAEAIVPRVRVQPGENELEVTLGRK